MRPVSYERLSAESNTSEMLSARVFVKIFFLKILRIDSFFIVEVAFKHFDHLKPLQQLRIPRSIKGAY